MSRYLGSTALEWVVYQSIIATNPALYRDSRGRPVIELPNPDATWEAHPVRSPRVFAWIQHFYASRLQGRLVLTKAEIERVALLLAGDAYVNAPPPIALPFEPTSVHEPLLQCVVEFMLHVYRQEGKTRFEDNATLLRVELLTAASRLGYAAQVVPVAAWLGRRLRDLVAPLATCGIDASFYLTDVKRFVILELRAGTLPDLDGRDPGLPPAAPRPVIHKPARSNGLESPDGTNGKQAEPDWGSLEQNGESDQ